MQYIMWSNIRYFIHFYVCTAQMKNIINAGIFLLLFSFFLFFSFSWNKMDLNGKNRKHTQFPRFYYTDAFSLRGLWYFYALKFFRQVNPHIQITVKIMCESIQVWILRGKRPPQCKTTGKRFHICRNMCFYCQQSLWSYWPVALPSHSTTVGHVGKDPPSNR